MIKIILTIFSIVLLVTNCVAQTTNVWAKTSLSGESTVTLGPEDGISTVNILWIANNYPNTIFVQVGVDSSTPGTGSVKIGTYEYSVTQGQGAALVLNNLTRWEGKLLANVYGWSGSVNKSINENAETAFNNAISKEPIAVWIDVSDLQISSTATSENIQTFANHPVVDILAHWALVDDGWHPTYTDCENSSGFKNINYNGWYDGEVRRTDLGNGSYSEECHHFGYYNGWNYCAYRFEGHTVTNTWFDTTYKDDWYYDINTQGGPSYTSIGFGIIKPTYAPEVLIKSPTGTLKANKLGQRDGNTLQFTWSANNAAATQVQENGSVISPATNNAQGAGFPTTGSFEASLLIPKKMNVFTLLGEGFNETGTGPLSTWITLDTLNIADYLWPVSFTVTSLDEVAPIVQTRTDRSITLAMNLSSLTLNYSGTDPGEQAADVFLSTSSGSPAASSWNGWIFPDKTKSTIRNFNSAIPGWPKGIDSLTLVPKDDLPLGATNAVFQPFYKAVRTSGSYAETPDPKTAIAMMEPGISVNIVPLASTSLQYNLADHVGTTMLHQGDTEDIGTITAPGIMTVTGATLYPASLTMAVLKTPSGKFYELATSQQVPQSFQGGSWTKEVNIDNYAENGTHVIYVVGFTPVDREALNSASIGIGLTSVSSGAPIEGGQFNKGTYGWVVLGTYTFQYTAPTVGIGGSLITR